MAPASLISMFVAPIAGRLTDRIGGKYILLTGLALFAAGMSWTAAIATATSSWQDFVPSLILAGLGMGCTFAPMTTLAMRSVEPRMAGAASGMLNTVRQVGAVIGTAAVGALLQNRLTVTLPAAAAARSGSLPPAARGQFVAGFTRAAQAGTSVGVGQGAGKLPPGIPASLLTQLERLAREAFSAGYVNAMHSTMIMPIAVLVVAALSCFAVRPTSAPGSAGTAQSAQDPATTRAPA